MLNYECPICSELEGIPHINHCKEYSNIIQNKKQILWQNNLFSIIPSLGPLNSGHLLIIPNRHVLSFSNLDSNEYILFNKIKTSLREFNLKVFNLMTEFFEHGTGCSVNLGGSCISHAHWHSLPVTDSVINILGAKIVMTEIFENDLFTKFSNSKEGYLFVEDWTGRQWFNNAEIFPSQFMRKYYAKLFQMKCPWDWRQYPNIDQVNLIIKNYHNLNSFMQKKVIMP